MNENEARKMIKSEINKFVFYRENNNKIFGSAIFFFDVFAKLSFRLLIKI